MARKLKVQVEKCWDEYPGRPHSGQWLYVVACNSCGQVGTPTSSHRDARQHALIHQRMHEGR